MTRMWMKMNKSEDRLRQIETIVLKLTAVLPFLFVAMLIVGQWPEYWKWIVSEMTPMTSLEVSVMYTTALVAFAASAQSWIKKNPAYLDWGLFAAGFFYLALDDRFAIHERIRDRILIPHDIRAPFLPWIGPGDFILLVYAAIGLILLPRFLRLFQGEVRARRRLIFGCIVAAIAVLMDSVEITQYDMAIQRLEQTVEECVELLAQILFLHATFIAWMEQMREDKYAEAKV